MSKFTHATTPPPAAQSEIKSQSEVVSRIKIGLQDTARVSDRGDQAGVPWVPRIGATHLSQGPGGVWYMRLAVPARIRVLHPELPAELKRSTKVASKRLALAKAREMCLDFCVKYTSGATMHALDETPHQSFALFYEDGKVRIDHSSSASPETLMLMTRCFERMMVQVMARGQRALGEPPTPNVPPAVMACMPPIVPAQAHAPVFNQKVSNRSGSLWLSNAIEEWLENGGTKFSELSWKNSYEPTFRVFRELIGEVRRDHTTKDGTTAFDILDIEMHRLTRSHIEAFHEGLKRLPANQGRSTKESEALERIRKGMQDKVKWPSLSSVDKKLGHVAQFISYAGHKDWVVMEVVSQMSLATQSAKANLVKASKNTIRKKGAVALTDFELKKMFHQPAFLDGAMHAAWRYWIPQICLYQGVRVSEASGLYTDDVVLISGVHCISIIPDDPENDKETEDDDVENPERTRKVAARTGVAPFPRTV